MKRILSIFLLLTALTMNAETFKGGRTDFRDETIYFAITTRFYDGDPANNVLSWDKQDVQIANNDPDWRGDFKGLIDKLDYIKALGFTAVWITPVTQNASGEDYHGYHSMDFSSVDLRYESRTEWGSQKDVKFQDLIDAAHAKGMKIILDIVLNHTSNFGEATLNPLFTRDQNIRNQASPASALIPNTSRLSENYFDQDGNAQYQERFKFFKNPQYDNHNYYHHYGTGWNWDEPNRWWGQIAGDCVDLNTENNTVAQHLVKCYGEFIKMGVDGFRIDTTGHIARLTFNKQFIPQFLELAEKYKSKRLNACPFFMFGECCARFGNVIYRNQHNLSSHFYTWKSEQSLLNQYDGSQEFWDSQNLPEGHDSPVGVMKVCESETAFNHSSNNVFMLNGKWHEPDYSQYSGFSVIDFPMHYNFNNAAAAVNIAKEGDKYYNDASYNVVYVDSHDYSPQPNDAIRFNGGTAQWAENLSLMFTFRGIPCIYYGSEVEFMKGKPIDVGGENNKTPRKESGRAYFGHYLEGEVSASDFGEYTASGNVAKTLDGDLAHHIRRLNMIRAAVPALRKGQYTWDGCSANGGFAFKRAYKDESYALVAINGGATFSNLPAGTYSDLVTGKSYTVSEGGSITVDAPKNQGQLRVLVKGWTGGKVGEDGKFIYDSSSKAHGGNPSFSDPGTTSYYTKEDAIARPAVSLNPGTQSFKTETLEISAKLNDAAVSGWYQIADGQKVNLTPGVTKTFTIGADMAFGESKNINWSAAGSDGKTYTGTATYKKLDPNAVITIYVSASEAPYLYVWDDKENKLNGAWPGTKMTQKATVGTAEYFYESFGSADAINIIFNNGSGAQTADIKGISSDTYFSYNGSTGYTVIENPESPGNTGNEGNGNEDNKSAGWHIYFDNSGSNWDEVRAYVYDGPGHEFLGAWGGKKMSLDPETGYYYLLIDTDIDMSQSNIIFHNGNGTQTKDGVKVRDYGIYNANGDTGASVEIPIEEPSDSEKPQDPDNSEDSDKPDNSDKPENSGGSDGSGNSDNPNNPDDSDKPTAPDRPDNSDKPGNSEIPDSPDTPLKPEIPDTPDDSENPDVPDNPVIPDSPQEPEDPDDSETPDSPEIPDNPMPDDSGIEGIVVEEPEPEYYTLTGVKVKNPGPGIYIKIIGTKREKIVIR